MYGDLATKLVRDAQRIQNLPQLPAYSSHLVISLVREAQALEQANDKLLESLGFQSGADNGDEHEQRPPFDPVEQPGTACALLINHLSIRRNKRCLLAYHRVRSAQIEAACWTGRDVNMPNNIMAAGSDKMTDLAEDDRTNPIPVTSLSPEETEYARKFFDLVAAYKGPFTDVDLTGSLEPPGDLFIDVRVVKDAGAVETEYGTINLTKNSQFFVRQTDVQQLLQAGYLQRLG